MEAYILTKQRSLFNKLSIIFIIFLFIGMSVISSTGNFIKDGYKYTENCIRKTYFIDGNDTTPPFTNCTFDPDEPDGENGWYIGNLTVELTAEDDLSGVKEIRISICGNPEIVFPGNYVRFFFDEDYKDFYIDYWAIDNAGNVEINKRFYVKMDKTSPDIDITFEVNHLYFFRELRFNFFTKVTDFISGIDRVEFYRNNIHQKTVKDPDNRYYWIWKPTNYETIKGIIFMPKITYDSVKFYSLFVTVTFYGFWGDFYAYVYDKAGNMNTDKISPSHPVGLYDYLLFQNITIPNNYSGHIGRFFIDVKINR